MKWEYFGTGLAFLGIGITVVLALPPPWWLSMPYGNGNLARISKTETDASDDYVSWGLCFRCWGGLVCTSPKKGSSQKKCTRACLQLSRIIAEAKWTPARKFLASLS